MSKLPIAMHAANFSLVANSSDLVYNFDTEEIKSDPRLRRFLDKGQVPQAIRPGSKNALPVFGDYDRALNYWYPELKKYAMRMARQGGKVGLLDMPKNVLLNLIGTGQITGIDLLGLCMVDTNFNKFCNENQTFIFRDLIQKEYPRFDDTQIPVGQEREAYAKLVQGGIVYTQRISLDANGNFVGWEPDIKDQEFNSIRKVNIFRTHSDAMPIFITQTEGHIYSKLTDQNAGVVAGRYNVSLNLARNIDQDENIFLKVEVPDPVKLIKLEPNDVRGLILTETGDLYSFAQNELPVKLQIPVKIDNFFFLFLEENNVVAITKDFVPYEIGDNMITSQNGSGTFRSVNVFDEGIKKIQFIQDWNSLLVINEFDKLKLYPLPTDVSNHVDLGINQNDWNMEFDLPDIEVQDFIYYHSADGNDVRNLTHDNKLLILTQAGFLILYTKGYGRTPNSTIVINDKRYGDPEIRTKKIKAIDTEGWFTWMILKTNGELYYDNIKSRPTLISENVLDFDAQTDFTTDDMISIVMSKREYKDFTSGSM